jgi:hypothetical protein
MATKLRDMIVESLAIGSALGFLTLILVALSLLSDSRTIDMERNALAPPPASASVALSVDDPSFDRIFAINDASGPSYGVVFSFRSPDDSALERATFSQRGELQDIQYLGACASRLPSNAKESLDGFVGANEALHRAADAVRSAAHGSSGIPEAGS